MAMRTSIALRMAGGIGLPWIAGPRQGEACRIVPYAGAVCGGLLN
jgi:hypothetical protein